MGGSSPSWGANGDDAIERQQQLLLRPHRSESIRAVPRYGAGRAVVQPFGNSGVVTDGIGEYGGGGGTESFRGLSDNDAVFGGSPGNGGVDNDDDDDLYHGSASFDQDGNYYVPTVQRREEEKKDEDEANRALVHTKLGSMFVSAGSQVPIGADIPGMGFSSTSSSGNKSLLSSHYHVNPQDRPHPKDERTTGPRRKQVARKSQGVGIDSSRVENEEIVTRFRPRSRRSRQLRVSQRNIDNMLAFANSRRNAYIMKVVEDVTSADIPAIVTSLIEPFLTTRRSRNLLVYLTCRDLAKASKISKNFHFWVERETSHKALDFKERSSLAWEVVNDKHVYSADEFVKTNFDLTMQCATSLSGDDEQWGRLPTHMDAIERVVGWCGGWLQFLHARENGAKPQPRSAVDRKKTTLGIHMKEWGGALPQAAIIFDLHRNGKWIWSGLRPISKEYLNRCTGAKDNLLRIYPFSEKTKGDVTDLDSPALLGSAEAKRAGYFLLSTSHEDRRTFTLSASLVSEVSAETLIHSVKIVPRALCRSLWREDEFHTYGPEHWNIGEGRYSQRRAAWSDDDMNPAQCSMHVSGDQRLVTYSHRRNKVEKNDFIAFNNCFWLDDIAQDSPCFHMMTELVCEKRIIYEMFLNTHR